MINLLIKLSLGIYFFSTTSLVFAADTWQKIQHFYQNSRFSDITLVAKDGSRFPCSSIVLATFSELFRDILENSSSKTWADRDVKIDLSKTAIKVVLDTIYEKQDIAKNTIISWLDYLELLRFADMHKNPNRLLQILEQIPISIVPEEMDDALDQLLSRENNENLLNKLFASFNGESPDIIAFQTLQKKPGFPKEFTFNPQGSRLITTSHIGDVRMWETKSGKLLHSFDYPGRPLESARYNENGKFIAIHFYDGTVKIIDAASNLEQSSFRIPQKNNCTGNVQAPLICNHDGSKVIFTGQNRSYPPEAQAEAYDGARGTALFEISSAPTVFYPQKNRHHASASEYIYLQNAPQNKNGAFFSNDLRKILNVGPNITVWSLAGVPEKIFYPNGSEKYFMAAAYNADKDSFIGCSNVGAVWMWNRYHPKGIAKKLLYAEGLRNVAISPDGVYLAASYGYEYCTLRLFVIAPDELMYAQATLKSKDRKPYIILRLLMSLALKKEPTSWSEEFNNLQNRLSLGAKDSLTDLIAKNPPLQSYLSQIFQDNMIVQ